MARAPRGHRGDVAVVIPAGGLGTRLGRRTPKQLLTLGRTPILAVTVRHFVEHPGTSAIVVAAPTRYLSRTRRLLAPLAGRRRLTVVEGGLTRQESVWRALQATPGDAELIVVHDAVRPFITRALIDAVLHAARAHGAALCALPIAETVKRVRGEYVETTLDRASLWAAQTPQAFRAVLLREAHEKSHRDGISGTDEAMLVERLGVPVRIVRGLEANVKITTPDDLRRARAWARR
jgi:2-C-methyl-D-erythritol 4-phosphate cytidylyltransferase